MQLQQLNILLLQGEVPAAMIMRAAVELAVF
jgi:hypothetical protein